MNRLNSMTFVAVLILSACGKPAPPHDLTKMATKVTIGMTKAEVITAIGTPDRDSETDKESTGKSTPEHFVLLYNDYPKILIVTFRDSKVNRIDSMGESVRNTPGP